MYIELSSEERNIATFKTLNNAAKKNRDLGILRTAMTLYRKLETNIPRNETARPQYQFLHSCTRYQLAWVQCRLNKSRF